MILRTIVLLTLLARVAGAIATDRIGVEVLAGESPREAALAYERACYRLGAEFASVTPVQTFEFEGANFARLEIDGTPFALRCLNALEKGRRGVDGTVQWFDGFEGAMIVPATEPPKRLPEVVFVNPSKAIPPAPPLDREVAAKLATGDAEAIEALKKLPLEPALDQVNTLASLRTPAALASLEQVAKSHPHWRVRRAALDALDPSVSMPVVASIARDDAAWEVRLGAVELLGVAAEVPQGGLAPQVPLAADALLERIQEDPAPEVRRAAIWRLSSALVGQMRETLENKAKADPDARVRAVAFETLAGAGYVTRRDAIARLNDGDAAIRAVAADVLVAQMEPADAPQIWEAMTDDDRLVRIAASRLLDRIDDDTISPMLWALFVREADELDADPTYLQRLTDALRRHPYPGLEAAIAARLGGELAPGERLVLSRLLSSIAPQRALALLGPQLSSPDHVLRAIAVETAPETPAIHQERLKLLEDPDADLRAAAVLGLCQPGGASMKEVVSKVPLEPVGVGREAAMRVPTCGDPEVEAPRLTTHLLDVEDGAATKDGGFWPAVAAIALLIASIIGIKVARPPESKPADAG